MIHIMCLSCVKLIVFMCLLQVQQNYSSESPKNKYLRRFLLTVCPSVLVKTEVDRMAYESVAYIDANFKLNLNSGDVFIQSRVSRMLG
jgi:hypothetical protein